MKNAQSKRLLIYAVSLFALTFTACNQENTTQKTSEKQKNQDVKSFYTNYGMDLPEDILTPDEVNTSIGTIHYNDGRPTDETVKTAYEFLDRNRAVDVFLTNLSAVASAILQPAFQKMGAQNSWDVLISEQLIDAHQVWPTGNTGTVYLFAYFDMKKDGAMVIEIPKGCGPGFMDDAWMRWIIDFGPTGPDKGQGATYVILPPDYEADIEAPIGGAKITMNIGGTNKEVFVVKSPTYHAWIALRGFLVDGKPDVSVKMFKDKLKIYPLNKATDKPEMNFVNMSDKNTQAVFPASARYFKILNDIVQREPIEALDPETRGKLASVGIEKGKAFNFDKWKDIYEDAAKIGDAIGRSLLFAPRDKDAYIYPARKWYHGFLGGSYQWLKDNGRGGIYLDARTLYMYGAIAVTPGMVMKMVGIGSQYAFCSRDKDGKYFDGSKTYKLTMPANVPAKDFWSIVVYDPQTRAMLPTGQKYPAVNNKRGNLKMNKDGSVDLYFGPKAPKGYENNWVETVPGKGWFVVLRLYGPLEPWFNKTWKPNDFELVK